MTKKTMLNPLLEDDLARIDLARDVVDEMGVLARSLCYRPYVTRDQIARLVQWRETFCTAIHATERMAELLQTMPELEGLIQKAALVTEIAGDLQKVIDDCPGAVSDFPALQQIASKVARYAKP